MNTRSTIRTPWERSVPGHRNMNSSPPILPKRSRRLTKEPGKIKQHLGTGPMAITIIDRFEIVDIENGDASLNAIRQTRLADQCLEFAS